jgi:ankyrin repeat protein
MQLIRDYPKISMSVILLTGISFFLKNRLTYFFKKRFFLYQSKNNDVNKTAPTLTHPIINPNAQDDFGPGDTLLHKACNANDIEEVRLLLLYPDMDPNIRNRQNQTALWQACCHSKPEIVEVLLADDRTDPNIDRPLFVPPFVYDKNPHYLENILKIIKLFIENPKTDLNQKHGQYTLLSIACTKGWTEIVKMALEREDTDPNQSPNPNTYLKIAYQNGNKEIFELLRNHSKIDPADLFTIAVQAGYEDIVEELFNKYTLDTLKSSNSKSRYYPAQTALRDAAYAGNVNIFKRILNQQNPNVNYSLYLGQALCAAARAGHIEIVKLLLQHPKILQYPEIIMNSEDSCQETPFYSAIQNNHREVALLLYNHIPSIVDIKNYAGESTLMYAAQNQTIQSINFLIDECNANISIKDRNGFTSVYRFFQEKASDLNQLTFFYNYDHKQKKEFLNAELESFAQIKFSDTIAKPGKYTFTSFIDYCILYGANLNHRNNKGKRPLDIASDQYRVATQYIHSSSPQFIIKEKIYHAFLNKTERISDNELWYCLSRNGIAKDTYGHIMKYYCALNVDAYAARCGRQCFHKKNLLEEEYKRLNIFNDETKSFMRNLICDL